MVVVGLEHPGGERLAVVGVGAGLEQEAGERERVRVRRLVDGAELTVAEDAGQ